MVKIKQQQGIALITVLLIVVFITVATVSMKAHQDLDIRRSSNLFRHSQAVLYLQGAEYLSMSVLKEDKKKSTVDTLEEDWATVLPPFPVEGGSIGGILEDLSGKFNINNLVNNKGKKSQVDYKVFQNLLSNLKLDTEIADAVVDWIDKDDSPQPGGAEEGYYLGKDKQAYRAPNHLMMSTTELLRIKGVDFKTFKKIKNYITALPVRTKININTADKEVIRMISIKITDAIADDLIKGRDKNGYKTVGDFIKDPVFSGLSTNQKTELTEMLDIRSDHFLLTSTAVIGQLEIKMKSILKRDKKGDVTVLVRSQGGL